MVAPLLLLINPLVDALVCASRCPGPSRPTPGLSSMVTDLSISKSVPQATPVLAQPPAASTDPPSDAAAPVTNAPKSVSDAPSTGGGALRNPPFYVDIPDVDPVFDNTTGQFVISASSFHFSPSAPVLVSKDLANWQIVGHSVPNFDTTTLNPGYDLQGDQTAYVGGTWASSLRYDSSNGRWVWAGCIAFRTTFFYAADKLEGPWKLVSKLDKCFYDCGLLFDSTGTYLVTNSRQSGSTTFSIGQISNDLRSLVKFEQVYIDHGHSVEGTHLYKRGDFYYIFGDDPGAMQEWVYRSKSIWTGWESQGKVFASVSNPIPRANKPHQGGWVSDGTHDWYIGFGDTWPCGRIFNVMPMSWVDDWPVLKDQASCPATVETPYGGGGSTPLSWKSDMTAYDARFEWNHNPDESKISWGSGGLVLTAATTTDNMLHARNTLCWRTAGPKSQTTVQLDVSRVAAGDRAFVSLFRDVSSYIAVADGKLTVRTGITYDHSSYKVVSAGTDGASAAFSGQTVWLRAIADVAPSGSASGSYAYSTDGTSFQALGSSVSLTKYYYSFTGYRFCVGTHATKALGGQVTVKSVAVDLVS
ncbi:hypothetical protein PYCC9005_004004 [Savitreella phatthalungensis]